MEQIPFNKLAPQHDAAISAALLEVVRDDWFVLGTRLAIFERDYARFMGIGHCVGVGNGHDALVLALRSLGLGDTELPRREWSRDVVTDPSHQQVSAADRVPPSKDHRRYRPDEVLVPAHTCPATWMAISNAGCVPVPVDIDADTLNIDPRLIAQRVNYYTRAIVPVHLYGNPCDMETIMALAEKHRLKVVEDNAQAHGATFHLAGEQQPRATGTFGEANATSFYPTKNLGALGDGGAMTTRDEEVARRVRTMRNYGYTSKDISETTGINSRLDELQAAVLTVKLTRLSAWNDERRRIAMQYNDALSGIGDVRMPATTPGGTHAHHLYVIRTEYRAALQQHLAAKGVQTAIHYPLPPHLQKAYANLGYHRGDFPVAEQVASEVLSLPMWIGMQAGQVERVCEVIREFFEGRKK